MSWDKEIDEMHSREALAFEMGGADKVARRARTCRGGARGGQRSRRRRWRRRCWGDRQAGRVTGRICGGAAADAPSDAASLPIAPAPTAPTAPSASLAASGAPAASAGASRDFVGAAHFECQSLAAMHFVDLFVPAHNTPPCLISLRECPKIRPHQRRLI